MTVGTILGEAMTERTTYQIKNSGNNSNNNNPKIKKKTKVDPKQDKYKVVHKSQVAENQRLKIKTQNRAVLRNTLCTLEGENEVTDY